MVDDCWYRMRGSGEVVIFLKTKREEVWNLLSGQVDKYSCNGLGKGLVIKVTSSIYYIIYWSFPSSAKTCFIDVF